MLMLRTIPRRLRCHCSASSSWLQQVYRGLSSVSFESSSNNRRGHGRHQTRDRYSVGLNSSALFAAVIVGTAAYHWRNTHVSDCSDLFTRSPIIYVDWSVPEKKPRAKKRTTLLTKDDKGDSKSVHKSGLSGVELEEIPTTKPKSEEKAQDAAPAVDLAQSSPVEESSRPPAVAATPIENTAPVKEAATPVKNAAPAEEAAPPKPAAKPAKAAKPPREVIPDPEPEQILDESLIGIPDKVPYLIVGSGTAAMAAARSIRGSDPSARVLMIGEEPHSPYMRPPLSKELWRRTAERQNTMLSGEGDMKRHSWMFFEPDQFFIPVDHLNASLHGGIALWKGKRVVRLNVEEKFVEVDSGERVQFEKCLLATGGRPRTLQSLDEASKADSRIGERILYFRNIADFQKLRDIVAAGGRIVIVGGGFLGSELAVSLADLAKKQEPGKIEVVQVFRDSEGNMSHVLPPYLAEHTMKFMADKGVQIIKNDEVTGATFSEADSRLNITLQNNEAISADFAIVSVGLEANTDLADEAGLELDSTRGGFLVNAELEARGGVFAAGDACSYYDLLLGRRRVEHINHAEESGRIAGRNMAGEHVSYHHQSSFWSTLGREISWDAIGLIDASLETQAFFALSPGKDGEEAKMDLSNPGVVFYLRGGKLVGILLWNLPDDIYHDEKSFAPSRLNVVRKVLDDRKSYSYSELAELARHFDVHESISAEYEDLKDYLKKKEEEAGEEEGKPAAASGDT